MIIAANVVMRCTGIDQLLTFHCFVVAEQQHPEKMYQLFPPLPPFSTILENSHGQPVTMLYQTLNFQIPQNNIKYAF